jgi:hypothetical protein
MTESDSEARSESNLEPHRLADGTTVYVDRTSGDRGSEGPFFLVFESPSGETRWGFRCGACGSFDTAMDTMGRVVCNDCPNRAKPEEWDAAHE